MKVLPLRVTGPLREIGPLREGAPAQPMGENAGGSAAWTGKPAGSLSQLR